jgi:hypothetical protein
MQNPSGGFEGIIPQREPAVPCSYGGARDVIEVITPNVLRSTEY